MHPSYRLIDFNVYQTKCEEEDEAKFGDKNMFAIQMFGINERGKTCSIVINDYKPFFYIKVPNSWNISTKDEFVSHIKEEVGKWYENSIVDATLIKRKKLNLFDGGLFHQFVVLKFNNTPVFNKVKNMWYGEGKQGPNGYERRLLKNGYIWNGYSTELYESFIPPLLRYFHIRNISPSGWITFKSKPTKADVKTTTCNFEYVVSEKDIRPLNDKETIVPYKICSFDIEASSSHGDFPLPVKTYKKLATNIVDYWNNNDDIISLTKNKQSLLETIVFTAFGFESIDGVDKIFIKKSNYTQADASKQFATWINTPINKLKDDTDEVYDEFDDIESQIKIVLNTETKKAKMSRKKTEAEKPKASLSKDWSSICLLLLLYTLQGVPMGISAAIPMLLEERKVSMTQQGVFSFCSWPFSLKLLWAPIVDATFDIFRMMCMMVNFEAKRPPVKSLVGIIIKL